MTNKTLNNPKKDDYYIKNDSSPSIIPHHKESSWSQIFKRYWVSYGLAGLSGFSALYLEEPPLAMACGAAAIATSVITFLQHQRSKNIIYPENMFVGPAFIVSETGKIIRSNQKGGELLALYGNNLQDLLDADSFDEGACFRLLNSDKKHILQSDNIIYVARFLENSKYYLVTRFNKSNNQESFQTYI